MSEPQEIVITIAETFTQFHGNHNVVISGKNRKSLMVSRYNNCQSIKIRLFPDVSLYYLFISFFRGVRNRALK